MNRVFFSLTAVFTGLLLAGCQLQFTECVPMPGDALRDEANKPFVLKAKQIYEERMKFRCNVRLRPAKDADVFLTRGSFAQFPVNYKRDLMFGVKSALVNQLAGRRDFNLVGQEDPSGDVPVPEVTTAAGKSADYLMTYSIVNLGFEQYTPPQQAAMKGVNTAFSLAGSNRRVSQDNNVYYRGNAEVRIGLYDPSGKQLFILNGKAFSNDYRPAWYESRLYRSPDGANLLKEALAKAAAAAFHQYTLATAPPLYVTRTVGNGSFVQICGGTAYGITAGSRIRFFRNAVRNEAGLQPGQGNQPRIDEIYVGEGIVGVRKAPVEQDSVWVYIGDFRAPDKQPYRGVFEWTSAKMIR